jgi:hypothetical protein
MNITDKNLLQAAQKAKPIPDNVHSSLAAPLPPFYNSPAFNTDKEISSFTSNKQFNLNYMNNKNFSAGLNASPSLVSSAANAAPAPFHNQYQHQQLHQPHLNNFNQYNSQQPHQSFHQQHCNQAQPPPPQTQLPPKPQHFNSSNRSTQPAHAPSQSFQPPKFNSGPRNTVRHAKGSAVMNLSSAKAPACAICSQIIRGPFISAVGKKQFF